MTITGEQGHEILQRRVAVIGEARAGSSTTFLALVLRLHAVRGQRASGSSEHVAA